MKRLLVFLMMFCALSTYSLAQNWVGTWATAPQTVVKSFMPYNNCMTNRSVRQVVKVSIGGDVIRLKLSNIYSMQPVEIRSIYIAHAKDSLLTSMPRRRNTSSSATATRPSSLRASRL